VPSSPNKIKRKGGQPQQGKDKGRPARKVKIQGAAGAGGGPGVDVRSVNYGGHRGQSGRREGARWEGGERKSRGRRQPSFGLPRARKHAGVKEGHLNDLRGICLGGHKSRRGRNVLSFTNLVPKSKGSMEGKVKSPWLLSRYGVCGKWWTQKAISVKKKKKT